jgi:CRP/FNR family transcriptional regulator
MRYTNNRNNIAGHVTDQALDNTDRDNCQSVLDAVQEQNSSKLKHFSANEIIHREGDPVDRVYIILNGIVKLVSYLPNGRARIIRLHNSNQWLGLEGLTGQLYEHTAVAVGDVEVNYVPISSLRDLEQQDPWQYSQILKHVYRHLAQADKWIADFSTGGIKPRVARLLFFLSDIKYGKSSSLIDLLTVQEMADILGVTQESVSRILADFKRKDTLSKPENETSDETYEIDQRELGNEASQ